MIAFLDADDQPLTYAAHLCLARTEPEFAVGDSNRGSTPHSQVGFPGRLVHPVPATANRRRTGADLFGQGCAGSRYALHIREAGKTPSLDLTEAVEQLAQFEHEVAKGKQPGLYAQYVARVCDPDPA